jgi:hypothetical protein
MVGTLPGTDNLFRNISSLESHFGLGGPWEGAQYDGALWQWVDTAFQADANGAANARAISVETSDGGDPLRRWTPKQVDTLVRLGRWAADTHNIPKRIAPAWDAPGFGWHALYDPWNPNNHSCPAATRIRQLREEVLPRIFTEGEDMTPEEHAELFSLKQNLIDTLRQGLAGNVDRPIRSWSIQLEQVKSQLDSQLPQLLDDEADVVAAVNAVGDFVGGTKEAILAVLSTLNLSLSDEQIAAIAAQVNINEAEIAEAVRFRLHDALGA